MGVSDYKNWISDFRLQSSDYKTRFQITKIGFQISDYKNQISNVKSRFLAMADFRFQITKSHEITKSAMRLQEPHFKSPWNLHCMRRANFRFHISDFKSALTRFLKLAEFWFQITKRCNGALEIFRQISDFRFQGSTEFLKKPHADYKNEISDYKTQEMWRYGTLQISDFKQADYNLGNEMSTTHEKMMSLSDSEGAVPDW